jgi:8-oxo-dGTP pyrophosphatase MutT (NUDIX family)
MTTLSTPVQPHIHDIVKSFDIPLDALQARHPHKPLVVGVAVAKPGRSDGPGEHQILLVRRVSSEDEFPNAWELPGGGAEVGTDKTILDTVVRETFEETGLEITSITKIIKGFEYWASKGDAIQFNLLVEVKEPVEVKLNPEEHDEYAWAGLEDLERHFGPLGEDSRAVMRDVVVDALKRIAEEQFQTAD